MSAQNVHPEVLWAQRSSASDAERNFIYLTITAPDVPKEDLKFDLQPTKLVFSGKSSTKGVTYATEIEFFEEIDPKESKVNHTGRNIETVLRKKELKEEYWPRLLKEKARVQWLKTDFDKWADEDEQDANDDEDLMAKAGGFDGAGGFGGGEGGFGGGAGGFEGIDFSKFGSGPGGAGPDLSALGAMGGGLGGGDSDDEELPDEEDDEMPALEGETKGEKKSLIEEVE